MKRCQPNVEEPQREDEVYKPLPLDEVATQSITHEHGTPIPLYQISIGAKEASQIHYIDDFIDKKTKEKYKNDYEILYEFLIATKKRAEKAEEENRYLRNLVDTLCNTLDTRLKIKINKADFKHV